MAANKLNATLNIGTIVVIIMACVAAAIYTTTIQQAVAEQLIIIKYNTGSIQDHEIRLRTIELNVIELSRQNDLLEKNLVESKKKNAMLEAIANRLEVIFP